VLFYLYYFCISSHAVVILLDSLIKTSVIYIPNWVFVGLLPRATSVCQGLVVGCAVMGQAGSVSLVVPDELNDPEKPNQQWASSQVKQKLVHLACGDDYSTSMRMMSDANPRLAEQLQGNLGQDLIAKETVEEDFNFENLESSQEQEEGTDRKRLKRAATTEFILCLMLRNANMMIMPFFIACLSVIALKTGMSADNWSVMGLLSAQFSYDWAVDFAIKVSEVIACETEAHSHSIRLAVFDNCSYMTKTRYESEDSEAGLFNTVNWMRIPLAKAKHGAQLVRGQWHNGCRTFMVRRLFDPRNPRVKRFLTDTWVTFMATAMRGRGAGHAFDILARPGGAPPAQTFAIYMDPVLDVGTAKYADVDQVLHRIFAFYFLTCVAPAAVVLLVGDQQSYSRMIWQKKKHPVENSWYVPLPGEFHLTANALMAIHRLWGVLLTQWARDHLGWSKTVKDDWDSVEQWVHYDRFYLLLIAALTEYLLEVVPGHILLQPSQLIAAVANNTMASLVVRFLFEYGYPYLALRNAVRANDAEVIDLMWIISFPWFRATNKYMYAHLCIYVTAIRHGMVDALQQVHNDERTFSLAGNVGSNVGVDLGQERMNKNTKRFVSNYTDIIDRLRRVAALLNAFHWIWPRFLAAIGKVEPSTYERTDFKIVDKNKLLAGLRQVLPSTYAGLCQQSNANTFKTRPAAAVFPWRTVTEISQRGGMPTEDEDDLYVPQVGYDSEDDNDYVCHHSWYKYATHYLRKVPRV
jgi:hypothetical protein